MNEIVSLIGLVFGVVGLSIGVLALVNSMYQQSECDDEEYEPIVVGDKWYDIRDNPFGPGQTVVKVIGVKRGWVRFDMGGTIAVMPEDKFRKVYERVQEND